MRTLPARAAIFLATVTLLVGLTANAQEQTGRDVTIELDATEAPRKVLHARLVVPASPGRLTLLYPKWIPGEHGPTGPVNDLVGLEVKSAGKPARQDECSLGRRGRIGRLESARPTAFGPCVRSPGSDAGGRPAV